MKRTSVARFNVLHPLLSLFISLFRSRASLSRRRDVAPVDVPVQVGLIARTNGIVNRPFRRGDVILQLTPYTFDSRDRDACELCSFDSCASISGGRMKRQAARGEPLEKQEASRWTGLECKWIFDRDSNKRRASCENVVERTLDAR